MARIETPVSPAMIEQFGDELRKQIKDNGTVRKFESGATRDTSENKPEYAGYLSPLVIKAYGEYMMKHQIQSDGSKRSADNWKRGMPLNVYMDSGWRHFHDWWMEHDGYESREGLTDALCGLLFNVMGYLHEVEKHRLDKKDK